MSQRLALDRLKESIPFNILHIMGCIPWPIAPRRKRGRPYVYSNGNFEMLYCKDMVST